MNVRVRFAPSPTGYLHVGGARTALFNYLFVKHEKGKFILRIEDTDLTRNDAESEKVIYDSLKWLGIRWDEGPDIGGDYGPYRQSERLDIYKKYVEELSQKGFTYKCFCSDEELQRKRDKILEKGGIPQYDGTCRNLSEKEICEKIEKGIPYSIRFKKIPKDIILDDLVRGKVIFKKDMVGDFVIMRSTGIPTYNFAVVIDDYLMRISHVIRAEEHLSNTPRQIMLYEALGWTEQIPKFAHVSIILGRDRTKLSKRHGAVSITYYQEKGYPPEAVVNYLALLGWTPLDNKEIVSMEKMIEEFTLDRVAKNPAIFDEEKLNWMSGEYIRSYDLKKLTDLVLPIIKEKGYKIEEYSYEDLLKIVDSVRGYVHCISDIPNYVDVYFRDEIKLSSEAEKIIKNPLAQKVINEFAHYIKENNITFDNYKEKLKELQEKTGVKGKDFFMPIRVGLTGEIHGVELNILIPLLGRDRCLKRIISLAL